MNCKSIVAGFVMLLSVASIGCGGGSSSGGAAMTQVQASAAFGDVFTAMELAESGILANHSTPISMFQKKNGGAEIQKAILNGTRNPLPEDAIVAALKVSPDTTVTIPTYTYSCPSGGNIVVTGSYSYTTTSESASIVEAINACKDSGITMNGDPNIGINVGGSDNGTTSTVNITMTGGVTVGSSSCTTDLTVNASFSDKTGAGTETYSGTFCGVSLSGSVSL